MNEQSLDSGPPERHRPARMPHHWRLNRPLIVYVTVCTKSRKHLLATESAHREIQRAWKQADSWVVGRYVILPDHLHLFCAPTDWDAPNVKDWVGYWKSLVTRSWPYEEDKPLWQKDWDRQLRNGDSYSGKWQYIRNNPVRHGLVESVEQWPFQGEMHELIWVES